MVRGSIGSSPAVPPVEPRDWAPMMRGRDWLARWGRSPALVPLLHYPPAPDQTVIYAVGDIHGRADLLARMFDAIDADAAAYPGRSIVEVYLGDYVDRGLDSRGVLDLLGLRLQGRIAVMLRGNHEDMLLRFLDHGDPAWLNRAVESAPTIASYGVDPRQSEGRIREDLMALMPEAHRRLLAETACSLHLGDYFFVHAGVRPGVPLDRQAPQDLMRIRQDFTEAEGDFGAVVVHGHTVVAEPQLLPNRINIDTGAYVTNRLTLLRIGETGPDVVPV